MTAVDRKAWLAAIAFVALAGCVHSPATIVAGGPGAAPFGLRLLGQQKLDHRLPFGGTVVGGLSGIDYDPARDVYYLISDDRSEYAPTRFYTARLAIDAGGFRDASLLMAVTLRRADGSPYPPKGSDDAADAEAIRFDPVTDTLWWSSEGERKPGRNGGRGILIDPFVRQSSLAGMYLDQVPLPTMFRMRASAEGPRDNLVFEGLALSVDRRSLWVAMEAPLIEDGPVPGVGHGAWSRFTRHDRSGATGFGGLAAQYAYPIDPIPTHGAWTTWKAQNGVSEILAVDAHRFLVLERAYAIGSGWQIRLYLADLDGATDVQSIRALAGDDAARDFVPMKKQLVLDFDTLGIPIDNLEGVCFGPTLPDGHRTLVLVSDDNFNPGQMTQLLAFEIVPR